MACTVMIVAGAAFWPEPRGRLRAFAAWLGLMSYPVYLLHPLVHPAMGYALPSGWARIIATVIATFGLSMMVSRMIEQPARQFGRRLAK